MDFDDVVKGRRSIRGYLPKPVPQALIREVLAVVNEATGSWAIYARGWLDGSLAAGTLPDPVYGRPATVRDFVRDAQAGDAEALAWLEVCAPDKAPVVAHPALF